MTSSLELAGPKATQIKSLFAGIAGRYDIANDVMTAGLARRWRRRLVKLALQSFKQQMSAKNLSPLKILDAATGTGDLAIEFAKFNMTEVFGVDFCEPMLKRAPAKAERAGVRVNFSVADVLHLPFKDREFDIISIAYGIRNVENPALALQEMARVLKPGGRLLILETGDSQGMWLGPLLRFHFKFVVPWVGAIFGGSRMAYDYLNKSSGQFPGGKRMADFMRATELFSTIDFQTLLGGASYIYMATKA